MTVEPVGGLYERLNETWRYGDNIRYKQIRTSAGRRVEPGRGHVLYKVISQELWKVELESQAQR